MGLYLLSSDLEPCGRTHYNFSEHFSWNGKCTVQLLHHLSSIRPRFKSAQCSTSLFGQRHVRHHCLVQCIAQLFSYIGTQKSEHFSISLTDFPGKCNSWPTFPTLLLYCTVLSWFHCTTPLPRHSRRCLQKPSLPKALLRVHVGAKANVHYPRSCIVQDALLSVSENLGSVCVSFETVSQYTFLYRHSTHFGTLFPTVSYNPLSRQSTFPTHMTLCPQSLDIFPQFQLIDFMLVYRIPHCPLTVLLTHAFAMNTVTDIFFCWRWFQLTSLYCLSQL